MEVGLLLLSFVIFIVSIIKKKYRRSPLLLFSVLWFSIIFFYSLGAYGIYSSSDSTLKVYFYGIGCFFVGYILVPQKYKYALPSSQIDIKTNRKLKIFKYCIIISILVMFFRALRAIPFWLAGGPGAVKVALYGGHGELNGTGIESILFAYLADPMQIACLIYIIISVFQKNKNKSIIILSIVLTILKYIASGGKGIIMMVVILMFGYLLCNPKINIKKFFALHKKLLFTIIATICFVCFMMSLKDGGLFESAYFYLCGCIPMSDHALTMLVSDMPKFYGLMTFNGLLRIVFQVTSFFGFGRGQIELLNTIFEYYETFQDPIMVSPTQKFNAYTSMFTIFFMDYGYMGVIVLSLVFGILAALSQYRALAKPSYQSIGILLYVFIMIWGSMTRINVMFVHYAMALVFIFIFFPKSNLNKT